MDFIKQWIVLQYLSDFYFVLILVRSRHYAAMSSTTQHTMSQELSEKYFARTFCKKK